MNKFCLNLMQLVFLFLIIFPLFAQSPEAYFHNGANSYINGRNQEARQILSEGLKRFPNDPKINALLAKIKEEENKDQQQNQEQQQQQNEQEQKQQEQQQQEQQAQNEEKQQEEQQQAQPGGKKEISKEDAERILEALKNEEQDLLKQKKGQKVQGAFRGKDW